MPSALELELQALKRQAKKDRQAIQRLKEKIAAFNFVLENKFLNSMLFVAINDKNQPERLEFIATLLKMGADVNSRDAQDFTPLMLAVKIEDAALVKLFLNSNANILLAISQNYPYTPFDYAIKHFNQKIFDLLWTQIRGLEYTQLKKILNTSLPVAVYYKHYSCITLLIQAGADINSKINTLVNKQRNFTVLMRAATYEDSKIVRILLANNADLSIVDEVAGSALNIAHDYHNYETLDLCLEKIKTLELTNQKAILAPTWFHAINKFSSLSESRIEFLELLLAAGLDINIADAKGNTAFSIAKAEARTDLMRWLLSKSLDMHTRNKAGDNVLDMAIQADLDINWSQIIERNNKEIFKYSLSAAAIANKGFLIPQLLEAGADINAQNHLGFTPLMFAISNAREQMVSEFLAAGADVTMRTKDGYNALEIALPKNNTPIVHALLDKVITLSLPKQKEVLKNIPEASGLIYLHKLKAVISQYKATLNTSIIYGFFYPIDKENQKFISDLEYALQQSDVVFADIKAMVVNFLMKHSNDHRNNLINSLQSLHDLNENVGCGLSPTYCDTV